MAAITFPSNPTVGQVFTTGNLSYIWNGTVWASNNIATVDASNVTGLDAALAEIVDAAPAALNTLNELAAALGDDANFAATVTTELAGKQSKVGGVSDVEISYLDGVTSGIQSQINAKASSASLDLKIDKSVLTSTGDIIVASGPSGPQRLALGTAGQVLTSNGSTVVYSTPAGVGFEAVLLMGGF